MFAFLFSLFFVFTDWYFIPPTVETFTTPDAVTWAKPLGVTSVTVECWGGGGAGGGGNNNSGEGGGGAGGQYARSVVTYPSAALNIDYFVAYATTGTISTGGGGDASAWDIDVVVAQGGAGGAASASGGAGGIGSASGGIGDVVYAGGNGGNAPLTTLSGAGGGGAGSTGAGGNASGATNGTGTSENGGDGGTRVAGPSNGNAGNNYGGGGSGGARTTTTSRKGGNGAQGMIRITYSTGRRKLIID